LLKKNGWATKANPNYVIKKPKIKTKLNNNESANTLYKENNTKISKEEYPEPYEHILS